MFTPLIDTSFSHDTISSHIVSLDLLPLLSSIRVVRGEREVQSRWRRSTRLGISRCCDTENGRLKTHPNRLPSVVALYSLTFPSPSSQRSDRRRGNPMSNHHHTRRRPLVSTTVLRGEDVDVTGGERGSLGPHRCPRSSPTKRSGTTKGNWGRPTTLYGEVI